jgi:hypothetical protein
MFNQDAYNACDSTAKNALREYLDSKGIYTIVHEDYGPDIKSIQEVLHEVEIKSTWIGGEWPDNWRTVHIPARKKRLLGGKRIIFWVMNSDCTSAFMIEGNKMSDKYIKNIPNSRYPDGEDFYDLPVGIGKFVDITTGAGSL